MFPNDLTDFMKSKLDDCVYLYQFTFTIDNMKIMKSHILSLKNLLFYFTYNEIDESDFICSKIKTMKFENNPEQEIYYHEMIDFKDFDENKNLKIISNYTKQNS